MGLFFYPFSLLILLIREFNPFTFTIIFESWGLTVIILINVFCMFCRTLWLAGGLQWRGLCRPHWPRISSDAKAAGCPTEQSARIHDGVLSDESGAGESVHSVCEACWGPHWQSCCRPLQTRPQETVVTPSAWLMLAVSGCLSYSSHCIWWNWSGSCMQCPDRLENLVTHWLSFSHWELPALGSSSWGWADWGMG